MFDRYNITPRPQEISMHMRVVEKRAPTDESVRLLKEMETAAQERVIESVKVGNATFECVIHRMDDMLSFDTVYLAIISVNGRKLRVEHRVRHDERLDQHQHLDQMIDKVARRLAAEVVAPALAQLEVKRSCLTSSG